MSKEIHKGGCSITKKDNPPPVILITAKILTNGEIALLSSHRLRGGPKIR